MELNLGDLYEALAAAIPDRPAIVFRDRRWSFAQLNERTNRLANHLRDRGLAVTREHVYLYGGKDGKGYVLRVRKDGKEKHGGETAYAVTGVAVNEKGVIATSNAHFSKSVHLYSPRFQLLGKAEKLLRPFHISLKGSEARQGEISSK